MAYPYFVIDNKLPNIDTEIIQEYKKLSAFPKDSFRLDDQDFYISLNYYQRIVSVDLTLLHIIYTLNRYFISINSDYVAVRELQWNFYYLIPYSSEVIHIRKRQGNIFSLI